MEKKREFLVNFAYWSVIGAGAFLAMKYLLPISVPFILGVIVARIVVWISGKLRSRNKLLRLGLTGLIYGLMALAVTLLTAMGVSGITKIIQWMPEFYELKLLPFVNYCYDWCIESIRHFDPTLISALEMLEEGLLSALKSAISMLSGMALDLVSGVAKGVPSVVLSVLSMVFSSVFVVVDYERISTFASGILPEQAENALRKIRVYLTDTLFVVIRSYVLIMLLTFTELSILFSLFGIENPVVKAAVIALLDIMPILGTGGILIPWAVVSLVLGYTGLGIQLLVIYAIVTVIRNYVEPKIVGTQLGLHPIITLVAMFVGLRLFGFWGLFGLPVAISFWWKERRGTQAEPA